ncbi:hypothetical protein AXF14_00660 [Actinomyces radicidentis]|uniref:Uncharacterized protein n=1 Tax=Actinomyces radicidentis TaxID=111015 RepID=A0A0X8JCJ3_ACTRD|nr:hypothetical protein [Actinomyces radicidentis]AMD86385.1 hypothetical protein AXF14_00660 [Actinomyces radicidentis]
MKPLAWTHAVLLAAAGCGALAFLGVVGTRVHPAAYLAVLVAVLTWAGLSRLRPASPAFPVEPPRTAPAPPRDRHLADVDWMLRSASDQRTWTTGVRPRLAALATDRLREHHGVDAATDPDAARAALGEELWALVDGSAAPPRTTRALTTLIERIHAL